MELLKIDAEGKIEIPKKIMDHLQLVPDNTEMIAHVIGRTIFMEARGARCNFCNSREKITLIKGTYICDKCIYEFRKAAL